jgi:hypothetical protein
MSLLETEQADRHLSYCCFTRLNALEILYDELRNDNRYTWLVRNSHTS